MGGSYLTQIGGGVTERRLEATALRKKGSACENRERVSARMEMARHCMEMACERAGSNHCDQQAS